jgi:hypothetical protein
VSRSAGQRQIERIGIEIRHAGLRGIEHVQLAQGRRRGRLDDHVEMLAVAGDGQRDGLVGQCPRADRRVIVGADLIDGGGIIRGHDIQTMRRIVQHGRCRVRDADRVFPAEFRRMKRLRWFRRIENDADFIRLENAVGRAPGVVAAAIVVEHRNVLGGTFAEARADLQRVRILVVVAFQRFDFRKSRDVDALFCGGDNVMAAAIHGRTGLDADKAIAAVFVGMRFNFETADHSRAMQELLVVAQLFHMEMRFVREIPLHQQLAGEVVVARERAVVAGGARELGCAVM